MRAVIFDLWNTLVDWAVDESNTLREDLAASTGLGEDRFTALWQEPERVLMRTRHDPSNVSPAAAAGEPIIQNTESTVSAVA